jgi:hypothetical protein
MCGMRRRVQVRSGHAASDESVSGDGQRGNALFAELEDAEDDTHLHHERCLKGGENDTADRECAARDCGTRAHQSRFI